MSESLEGLTSNLKKSDGGIDNFKHTLKFINNQEQTNLLSHKKVFSYDYITSFDRFDDPVPPKDAFFSKLSKSHITEKKESIYI